MIHSLSSPLARELKNLNQNQRKAVTSPGSVVVAAGPGSGKTRTLVARAAYALETQVSPFRGVACITYTTSAAAEVRQRLRRLGVLRDARVVCGTVHSFCLNEVLRPYAGLVGTWVPESGQVLGDAEVVSLLRRCYDELAIADLNPQYRIPVLTQIRRAIVCEEDLTSFDQREVSAARLYEEKLDDLKLLDFEAMVSRALALVRSSVTVRDLLAARFPHLIVDEYQDMGGALHRLVTTLHDGAGLVMAAVGDADQSIFGFTGADPKYLNELIEREDIDFIPLDVNYRSGLRIIQASEAALGRGLGIRRPREGAADGDVQVIDVDGGLDRHALVTAQLVQDLAAKEPPHGIAILYPQRGPLLQAILDALEAAGVPHVYERDESLPPGSFSKFVQRCASRSVGCYQVRTGAVGSDADQYDGLTIHSLEADYVKLRRQSALPLAGKRLWVIRALQDLLDPIEPVAPEQAAADWLARVIDDLDLAAVAAAHPDEVDSAGLSALLQQCSQRSLTVQDLAVSSQVAGKVALTTYHSSKGRQFRSVVMPGLVNGIVPPDMPVDGKWQPPTGAPLAERRRGFFVAVSRAEQQLFLITGSGFHTRYGRWIERGPSKFLLEMQDKLSSNGGPV